MIEWKKFGSNLEYVQVRPFLVQVLSKGDIFIYEVFCRNEHIDVPIKKGSGKTIEEAKETGIAKLIEILKETLKEIDDGLKTPRIDEPSHI